MVTPEQRAKNRRLAWILVSIVLAFFFGVIVRKLMLG
ncbi:MAG: cytochrome oxidase small assembly protein [Pigmentiphaga sp.]|nr:cytochrome oxidase small assembly protein [Pigmentiphaga sp.]